MGSCGTATLASKGSCTLIPALIRKKSIYEKYYFGEIIGNGNFGTVTLCSNKADPSFKVAIKSMKKKRLGMSLTGILEEIRLLRSLDHPNIIKYYEMDEDKEYIYLIMEYCSGGELFERIKEKEYFCESEAASIMQKVLSALCHCHRVGIAHRDIKPENILYVEKGAESEIKLIDFGLAKSFTSNNATFSTVVGSAYYIAPEMLEGSYSFACDIWSLGIIFYILLSGSIPFNGDCNEEIFLNIKTQKLKLHGDEWDKVTDPAKDLVKKLLDVNPKTRITASQALNHPWFAVVNKYSKEIDELDSKIMGSINNYISSSKLDRLVMQNLVRTLSEKEISEMKTQFKILDRSNTGFINIKDFLEYLQKNCGKIDQKEIDEIRSGLDQNKNGLINYSEFLAATISSRNFLTEEKIWRLFKFIDHDDKGYLTYDDIQEILSNSPFKLHNLDSSKFLENESIQFKTEITFDEFKNIFLSFQKELKHKQI